MTDEVHGVELTSEELAVLKELAQDRMAYSRVFRKIRNFGLIVASTLVAYMTIFDNSLDWLRAKLGF